ncbi:MAG: hypothetical protein ABI266_01140 [Ginsengibacter sp.]
MNPELYRPFDDFQFEGEKCFLSGKNAECKISVFPGWLMNRYDLHEKTIVMLAENAVKYQDLKLPCSNMAAEHSIDPLEKEIEIAFNAGYQSVKKLTKKTLFQWIGKLVYGVLYNDIVFGIKQQSAKGKQFSLSPLLTKKISNLHSMLQSMLMPMDFQEVPWSIEVVKLNYSKDIFNYKDETKNLNFSLGMNGFGIIACLQDNGENSRLHENLMQQIGDTALHPIQFEELWSRFLYSNYLLYNSSEYSYTLSNGEIIVAPIKAEWKHENLFGKWDDKMFAQVLANYWKPWGLTMKDIFSFPNPPISYLIDEYTNTFILPGSIEQPF